MFQDIFIGREREQKCYRDFLTTDTPWVLIITGLGQSGKSRLLRQLKERTPRNIPVAKLDFAMNGFQTDHLSILREIARQIEVVCKPEASAAFKKAVDDGRNKITALSAQAKQDIIHQEINIDGGEAIGNQLRIQLNKNIQEIKRQVLEEVFDPFYTQLATFSFDRFVLMLDTCEWLNQVEVGPWVLDELIPELCTRMHEQGKQFTVVIAGRVQPNLNAIEKQDQQTLRLPLFSKLEVGQYLQYIGVYNPTILDYVYDLTCGHAGSMLILYKLCVQQESFPSSVEELMALQDQFIESVRTDIIEDDILNERFMEPPYRELTRYGVLLRHFNQAFLQFVFPEWLPDSTARELFDRFTRFPHVMPPKENYYTFFDLLREILVNRIFGQEKVMWSKYHWLALNYLTKVAPQTPEWYYHDLACKIINKENMLIDREELAQIKKALQEAKARNKPTRADVALLEAASDKTLKRILQEAENAEEELVSN
jgi:hypothetical protein